MMQARHPKRKAHKRGPAGTDKRIEKGAGEKKGEVPRNIAQKTGGMLTLMLLHCMKENANPTTGMSEN